jgi:hypothetical protein
MHRTAWKIVALAFVCTLVLVPRGRAQQDSSPRLHPPGILMVEAKHAENEDEEHEHGRRDRRDTWGTRACSSSSTSNA